MKIYVLVWVSIDKLEDTEDNVEGIGGILPIRQVHLIWELFDEFFQAWRILTQLIDP